MPNEPKDTDITGEDDMSPLPSEADSASDSAPDSPPLREEANNMNRTAESLRILGAGQPYRNMNK